MLYTFFSDSTIKQYSIFIRMAHIETQCKKKDELMTTLFISNVLINVRNHILWVKRVLVRFKMIAFDMLTKEPEFKMLQMLHGSLLIIIPHFRCLKMNLSYSTSIFSDIKSMLVTIVITLIYFVDIFATFSISLASIAYNKIKA